MSTLIHGDALDRLKYMGDKSVDLVFYDPPYNVGKKYDSYLDNLDYFDYMVWMQEVHMESVRVSRRGVVVYISGEILNHFWRLVAPQSELIIVHKRAAGVCKNNLARQFHAILTTAKPIKRTRNVWLDVRLPGEGYLFHEKRYDNPGLTGLELTRRVIETFTLEGETVVDPFMGVGTTAEACESLNRNWIGIEQSSKYIYITKERLGREI